MKKTPLLVKNIKFRNLKQTGASEVDLETTADLIESTVSRRKQKS